MSTNTSTTTQEHTPVSSPQLPSASSKSSGENKADKKKLKILKQALKDERAIRGTIEKELESSV